MLNQFIKYIKFDDEKRILVSVQESFEQFLKDPKVTSQIKQTAIMVLKDDFVKLEVGKNVCRLTVKEGTEDKSMELVKTEIQKALNMAMSFMQNMQNSEE